MQTNMVLLLLPFQMKKQTSTNLMRIYFIPAFMNLIEDGSTLIALIS